MINKYIEIVSSSESWLSSMGAKSRSAVRSVLEKQYSRVGVTLIKDLDDLGSLAAKKPDLVFLGMKYVPLQKELKQDSPDKVWLGDYLESRGINCTGSRSEAHELDLYKDISKRYILEAGLKTSPYYLARQGYPLSEDDLEFSYPMFVKPNNRGGGVGIDGDSLVYNFESLMLKVQSITDKYNADSLIEEYLPGREFSVAVINDPSKGGMTAMPIELVAAVDTSGIKILSSKNKSSNSSQVIKVTDKRINAEICNLAKSAFIALGARDFGRFDIRMNDRGEAQFLEANLIPSLIKDYGSFPIACELNIGLSHEQMLLGICSAALNHGAEAISNHTQSDLKSKRFLARSGNSFATTQV